MATIIFRNNLLKQNEYDIVEVETGGYLIDHLMDYWIDKAPKNLEVYEGLITEASKLSFEQLSHYQMKKDDVIHAISCPADAATVGFVVLGLIIGVLGAALIPEPKLSQRSSPNPSRTISGQTNIARPNQRVPEIFGKNVIYPDLAANSISEYRNQIQYVTELLVVGVGFYEVDILDTFTPTKNNLRSGTTLLDDMAEATYEIFDPADEIVDLLDVRDMNEVDGQEIVGQNTASGTIRNLASMRWLGSSFEVSTADGNWIDDHFSASDPLEILEGPNIGTFTFLSISFEPELGKAIVDVTELPAVSGTQFNIDISTDAATPNFIGPLTLPTIAEQIWIDLKLPRGLSANDADSTVTLTFQFNLINQTTGAVLETINFSQLITENTYDELNFTFKFFARQKFIDEGATTIPNLEDFYSVKITNNTADSPNSANPDTVQWSRAASVTRIIDEGELFRTFPDTTLIRLETRATAFASSLKERQFNGVFTRKLPVYNPITNTFGVTPVATRQMMDAFLYMATNDFGAGFALTDIDGVGIDAIQDKLNLIDIIAPKTRGNQGECNLILSELTSPDQDLITIANTCRCFVFREGQILKLTLDEKDKTPTALFNRRNKTVNETKTFEFSQSTTPDGIKLTFVDETENYIERIYEIPINRTAKQPLELQIDGITNWEQAYRRGRFEFNRLQLQNIQASIETTYDGRVIGLNDLILNVDAIGIKLDDGNVVDAIGTTLIISNEFVFAASTYTITLRDPLGTEIFQTSVIDGAGANRVIIGSLPPFEIVPAGTNNEVGTLYSIIDDTDSNVDRYLVTGITPSDDLTKITLTNFDEGIYANDSPFAVPDKNTELNIN